MDVSAFLCLGPIPSMIGAELFRQGPRPRAMSLGGLANWLFTLIIGISFELIQVRNMLESPNSQAATIANYLYL